MLRPMKIQKRTSSKNRKGRRPKNKKHRLRPPCVLHFDAEGHILRFSNFDMLAQHMKSCGHGLAEGYKCGGGPQEDCRKAWKKHQYEEFAEHMTNKHSTEDPRNPEFEYGAAEGGYYCGFCVKRISTTTHKSLLGHLRGLHFKPEELTDIRLWVNSNDVNLSGREEAIQRAHEVFIKETDLNP
ncbi:hypothetical protein TWF788_008266 [Orbilia oligospora]|uniref:Uncharacterized protein n=1 Tax=Orbilia oligospora TaxID=2813651 RepID=A0A7C8U2S3_ORBOL|nr:hypothetical protein TWF788_008266 [Orbilia oligospora]